MGLRGGDAEGEGVPEIDLAGVADAATRGAVVAAMARAWRAWGAFVVVNHGVEPAVVEGARQEGLRVFALPLQRKLSACREEGQFAGYGNGAGSRATHNAQFGSESFRVGVPGPDTATFAHKLWPGDGAPFCEAFAAYVAACQRLSAQVVGLLGEGMADVDRAHVSRYFAGAGAGSVRLNYYPAAGTEGLPAHTDAAAVVLLHQSDGADGLQVHKDGQWVTVPARSDAFVVLLGTVYQILTNGEFKAGLHRAVKGGNKERLSMVFSLWPNPSLPMTPAPTFLAAHKQRLLYKPLTFPQFWDAREADLLNPLNSIVMD